MPTPPLPNCPGPGPHNGGGALGPLYVADGPHVRPRRAFACAACCEALGLDLAQQMPWPRQDVTADDPYIAP